MKKKLLIFACILTLGLAAAAWWFHEFWGEADYTWDDEYAPDGYRSDFQSTHSAHP